VKGGIQVGDSLLAERIGRVLVMTINRPEARNAINHDVAKALVEAVHDLNDDSSLSAGVLAGSGSSFCAGMDLKAFAEKGAPRDLFTFYQEGSTKPLVAAVNGSALGGGLELALTCDLIVAGETAQFGAPEVTRGLFAAGGGLLRLGRRLPYGMAMEMVLTGRPISAQTAYEHGLVNRLTAPDRVTAEALALTEQISSNAPLAVNASKNLLRESAHLSEEEFWEHQKAWNRIVLKSSDAKEGARAFAEKRSPKWTGA
jgi:enoyl-CoA hydratase